MRIRGIRRDRVAITDVPVTEEEHVWIIRAALRTRTQMANARPERLVAGFRLPWFYGWNVIAVSILVQAFTVGVLLHAFTFWLDPWTHEFSASRGSLAMAAMLTQTIGLLLAPIVGRAMDRGSIRAIISFGITCFAVGLIAATFATAAWQIVTIYGILMALAFSCATTLAGQTLAAKWFRARRGTALGWVAVGTSIGGFLVPPTISMLFTTIGWRGTNLLLAASAIGLLVPLVLLVVRNSPEQKGIDPDPEPVKSMGASADSGRHQKWTTGMILRNRTFWIIILAMTPSSIAFSGFQINFKPYTQDLGITTHSASLLISLLSVATFGAKLAFGRLADRLDHRLLLIAALGFMTVPMVGLAARPNYMLLALIVVTLGIGVGGILPLLGAIISTRFGPHAFGQVYGLFMFAFAIVPAGGPIAGFVRDASGGYRPFFLALASVMALVMIAVAWLPHPQQRAA